MRYVQLRAFHFVAISGGFSRAAEMLHLTQPAISDQVRKLETEYDVRLFNREKKQISLTPTGERLLDHTRRMFEVEDQIHELLSESRAFKTGHLTITADSIHHLTSILKPFREGYPSVFVSVGVGNTETVMENLYSYEADIGVLGEIPQSRDFEIVQLSSTPIIAFAAADHPMADRGGIDAAQLTELRLVLREKGSKTRAKLEDFANEAGIRLDVIAEAEGREAVREIVASGDGIGVVSEAEFGTDPRFRKIRINGAGLTMDEALICLRERRESRLIHSFMQLARTIVATR